MAFNEAFHRRQHFAVIARLAMDDAIRMKTGTSERRVKEIITASQAPENGTREPRRNSDCQQRGKTCVRFGCTICASIRIS